MPEVQAGGRRGCRLTEIRVKMQAREAVGAALLTMGSWCAGAMLPTALVAGMKALSPFESVMLADGLAAITAGAWMLLAPGKNPNP